MTDFKYYSLADTGKAQGVVVVIDVLRAFTTAAYAFNAGAVSIYPIGGIDEALELKKRLPGTLVMGEDNGIKPPGFDFGNSPVEISKINFGGKSLIQRTSAGTQGLVKARNAERLLAASFLVASATADYLRLINPDKISFIVTGQSLGRDGDEDRACGEYIQALICDNQPDPEEFIGRVRSSSAGRSFIKGNKGDGLKKDYEICIQLNKFSFIMPVSLEGKNLVMKKSLPFGS